MIFDWEQSTDGAIAVRVSNGEGGFRYVPKAPPLPVGREGEHPSGLDVGAVSKPATKARLRRLAQELIDFLDQNPNA